LLVWVPPQISAAPLITIHDITPPSFLFFLVSLLPAFSLLPSYFPPSTSTLGGSTVLTVAVNGITQPRPPKFATPLPSSRLITAILKNCSFRRVSFQPSVPSFIPRAVSAAHSLPVIFWPPPASKSSIVSASSNSPRPIP
jgi:hypothetical protein